MKRVVISSALLAASGLVLAQSSVTLFGVTDVSIQRGSGSVASRTQLGSGGLNTSRLGFRGVEDLGGGMSASFWLESAIFPDNGAGGPSSTNNQPSGTPASLGGAQGLTFARRSTVSLSGGWGELRMGRDFSPQYLNRSAYDVFGTSGMGATQIHVGSIAAQVNRVSNGVAYWLPSNLGGLYGTAAYYLGENASNAPGGTSKDGTGVGARLGWRSGPFDVAVSHAVTKYATTATAGDITSTNIGALYNIGEFTVMGGYYRDKVDTIAGLSGRGAQFGGSWRVGVGEVRAMLSKYKTTAAGNPETTKLALGYVHNLSKRTALYGTYARVRNSGGATTALNGAITAANQPSSGLELGVRHAF